jgi:hypothetical protein
MTMTTTTEVVAAAGVCWETSSTSIKSSVPDLLELEREISLHA